MTIIKTFLILYYEFFKTGLFALGGGLATIPFLKDSANAYTWFSIDMLGDMIAISESTPGPIGVNMATYSGFNAGITNGGLLHGIIGGMIATLGLVTPSIIIILIISRAYRKFKENPLVESAFYTIRPAVTGMIGAVAITLIEAAILDDKFSITNLTSIIDIKSTILFIALLIVMNIKKFKKLHPITFIALSGLIGAIFAM